MKSFIEWLKTSQYLNSDKGAKAPYFNLLFIYDTSLSSSNVSGKVLPLNISLAISPLTLSEFKAIYKSYLTYINKDK